MKMKYVVFSRKIICSLKTRNKLYFQNNPWDGFSNCKSCRFLSLTHHSSTRQGTLRQSQLVSSNMSTMAIGNYSVTSYLTPGSSANIQRYPVFCLLQFSRSIFSSAVTGFSNGSLCRQRFFSSHKGMFSILKSSQHTGETYYAKRYVGRSSRNQDNDVNNNSITISGMRYKLHDRTRSLLKGRVSRLQISIMQQKAKLRDKIKAHRMKGALAVGKLHKKFGVKKEDVRTIPNLLTTLRMASAPLLAYLVVNESFGPACIIFVAASITDMLDGYIARNFKNQTTALGTALDPLADKLLVSFLTVSLTSVGLIPVPMTVLILSRDVGLIAAAFYIRYISLAPPRTLSRYFDVSHVTAKLHPSKISKVNTLLQLSFVASTLASPVFDFVGHPLLQTLMYLTATTTFLSGADYMLTWRQRLQIIRNK